LNPRPPVRGTALYETARSTFRRSSPKESGSLRERDRQSNLSFSAKQLSSNRANQSAPDLTGNQLALYEQSFGRPQPRENDQKVGIEIARTSAIDEDGDLRMSEHFNRLAAEHNR
jgi:hypothetical protein